MKKLFFHIMLLSYAMLMIKPVLPFVSDLIAHVVNYKQHMATMHFENGKYHVHLEIAKNVKDESGGSGSHNSKKESSTDESIIPLDRSADLVTTHLTIISVFRSYNNNAVSGHSKYNYPPPKV